jgi:DNA-binding transcriptional LysR family regulator
MRLNGLDLNLLVALHAVLTEKSVTRAAERVALSQPAMSNAMSRLRDYFQDELVVRSGRKLILTARAETLIGPVREVLLQIENTIATAPGFEPRESQRQFSLLVSDFTATVLVAPLIQKIYRSAPGVGFRLLTQEGPSPADMLERGEADLLIVPEQYLAKDHPSVHLFDERYLCVTWLGSRIRRKLSLAEYVAAGHVVTQFSNSRYPALDSSLMATQGITRRAEVIAHNLTAPAELVVGTDRVATMHARLAKLAASHLPLRLWQPPLQLPKLIECAQWNRARAEDPGLKWLIQMCREVAAEI